MAVARRRSDEDFKIGAVHIVRESGSRSHRSNGVGPRSPAAEPTPHWRNDSSENTYALRGDASGRPTQVST